MGILRGVDIGFVICDIIKYMDVIDYGILCRERMSRWVFIVWYFEILSVWDFVYDFEDNDGYIIGVILWELNI